MKKKNKQTTIDDLAVMINRGFIEAQKNVDIQLGDMDKRLGDVDKRLGGMDKQLGDIKETIKIVVEEVGATHADVRYIKKTVEILTHGDTMHEASIQNLTSRVRRLEQKVGLAK